MCLERNIGREHDIGVRVDQDNGIRHQTANGHHDKTCPGKFWGCVPRIEKNGGAEMQTSHFKENNPRDQHVNAVQR